MTRDILLIPGGIGLFLYGMQVMTLELRHLAGWRLRNFIARLTTTPASGAVAGAAATAVIQSSSAVVLTTIGFVGAGIMTFPQAIGVIYGANIGTTITGWMVALLGLKLQLGTIALPLLFAAALLATTGAGRWGQAGRMIAGFCLIFLGLDLMQQGAAIFETGALFANIPGDTLTGRAILLLVGIGVTLIVQSSSAGVSMALVLLGTGTVTLPQAAAMVIGMDIGTTFKSLLVTIGGSRDMRRTAVAHVGYNIVTGIAAFLTVGIATNWLIRLTVGDTLTALVGFHTLFNLLGVVLMLPLTRPFARLIEWMIPGREPIMAQPLDRALLKDAGAALDAARGTSDLAATALFGALAGRLGPQGDGVALNGDMPQLRIALDDLENFAGRIAIAPADTWSMARRAALLHRIDHLQRLLHRAQQTDRIAVLTKDAVLRRPVRAFAASLALAATAPAADDTARRLKQLTDLLQRRTQRLRRSVLLREYAGLVSPTDLFELTDAIRWLGRASHHAERIVHYGTLVARESPENPAMTD